ncbi:MAG: cytochrome c biogenesis protein CcsA, partial [Planctomycetes bacterium]|nr:cytochrome c biogenesis protein CcsA [Planctomycetota bacterium]
QAPFPRDQAYNYWSIIHGASLLLGTVVVMLGFVAGVMYLVQSYRLKHKLAPRQGLRLPSLEWLQRMNEDSFVLSSVLLAAGLVSGVVLNLIRHANESGALPWTDPVVWTSGILFLWLAAASVFNLTYKPARQGRKVAYLTVASFVFLGFALSVVLFGSTEHASSRAPTAKATTINHAGGLPPGRAA